MNASNAIGRRWFPAVAIGVLVFAGAAQAADHLDTPRVVADPRGDIGDLFAWTSTDGRALNLIMTLVGHSFSDRLVYAFHVDSGREFHKTTESTTIKCQFDSTQAIDCRIGDADRATGDANRPEGMVSRHGHFRVFTGVRDDPFFNNVKGTREAYDRAARALRAGAAIDESGCPTFDQATVEAVMDRWRHTSGGPATNFLKSWTPASIVISIDLDFVTRGGGMLAVWATTSSERGPLDRMGRPLTANALLATLGPDEISDQLKDQYNRATPGTSGQFTGEIEKGLAFYDGLNGRCGDQWLAQLATEPTHRYRMLARLLIDDRLWVNSASRTCRQFFAVELAELSALGGFRQDCGGRTPNHDAVDVYRSLLVDGATSSVTDGVDRDEAQHSIEMFPFLAAPIGSYGTEP